MNEIKPITSINKIENYLQKPQEIEYKKIRFRKSGLSFQQILEELLNKKSDENNELVIMNHSILIYEVQINSENEIQKSINKMNAMRAYN